MYGFLTNLLAGFGAFALIFLILLIVLIPFICTIILGTYFATALNLEGIVWWSFVIIFYIIIIGIMGVLI